MSARVLVYDIESSPNLGYIWGKYQQDVIAFAQDWFMLSFAWKWLGDKKTHVLGLPDFPNAYALNPHDDSQLVARLWDLFNEADVTVTHNGKTFDKPKAQARMIYHGMEPPSPHKEIDTLQTARRQFAFTSNSLKDLAIYLGLEHKQDPGGFQTWLGCLGGSEHAWKRMKRYNRQDVIVTEQLYLRFRPWITNHPNLSAYDPRPEQCPRCSVEGKLMARGWRYSSLTKRKQYQCTACGGYCCGRSIQRTEVSHLAS